MRANHEWAMNFIVDGLAEARDWNGDFIAMRQRRMLRSDARAPVGLSRSIAQGIGSF
jgi:hypothetical protein